MSVYRPHIKNTEGIKHRNTDYPIPHLSYSGKQVLKLLIVSGLGKKKFKIFNAKRNPGNL